MNTLEYATIENQMGLEQQSKAVRSIAKNAGFWGVAEVPLQLIQLINGILVTRTLGVASYGLYVTAQTAITLLRVFTLMGLQQGVVRFIGMNVEKPNVKTGIVRVALAITLLAGVFAGAALFLSADFIAERIFRAPIGWMLKWLALVLVLTGPFEISLSCLRSGRQVIIQGLIRKMVLPLANLMFTITVFAMGLRLNGLIFRDIFVLSALLIVSLSLLNKYIPFSSSHQAAYDETKALLKFSLPLLGAEFLYVLMQRTDILLISAFLSPVDVGQYGVILRITALILVSLQSVDAIVFPMISEAGIRNLEKIQWLYNLSVHWALLVSTPMVIGTVLVPDLLLRIFGDEFHTSSGMTALIILAFGNWCLVSFGSVAGILSMLGHSRLVLFNVLIGFFIIVGLDFFLIPIMGIVGAALVGAMLNLFWGLTMSIEVYILYKLKPPIIHILSILFVGVMTMASVFLGNGFFHVHSDILRFLLISMAVGVMFYVLLRIFNLIRNEDKIVFSGLLDKLKFSESEKA